MCVCITVWLGFFFCCCVCVCVAKRAEQIIDALAAGILHHAHTRNQHVVAVPRYNFISRVVMFFFYVRWLQIKRNRPYQLLYLPHIDTCITSAQEKAPLILQLAAEWCL
jgi:hypothetical protein